MLYAVMIEETLSKFLWVEAPDARSAQKEVEGMFDSGDERTILYKESADNCYTSTRFYASADGCEVKHTNEEIINCKTKK